MKFNCPDCTLNQENCEGCPRTFYKNTKTTSNQIPHDFWSLMTLLKDYENIPARCRNCSNHPSNNPYASGICNCTAPLFDPSNPWKITCGTTLNTYFVD